MFSCGSRKFRGHNCGMDALLNSVHTITVASCDYRGRITEFSERCSSIMVTTYSGLGFPLRNHDNIGSKYYCITHSIKKEEFLQCSISNRREQQVGKAPQRCIWFSHRFLLHRNLSALMCYLSENFLICGFDVDWWGGN